MNVPEILLFGPNGQVGWELRRALAVVGPVVALDRHSPDSAGDLACPDAVAEAIRRHRPQVVVNAGAYTAVDKAESEPELAKTVNADAPAAMARACAEMGVALVHYSTDYVFDGGGDTPWKESDPTGPLNTYGRTKLAGEDAIRASGAVHLILRTSWVHAWRGNNFVKTMLRLAAERERLTVVDDQFGAPTGADLIADATAHAIVALRRDASLAGTYHLCGGGCATWFDVARFAIERAKTSHPEMPWKVETIDPVPSASFPTPARRPSNSRMDTTKLRSAFGLHIPDWTDGVARLVDQCAVPSPPPFGK